MLLVTWHGWLVVTSVFFNYGFVEPKGIHAQ